jgi:hypothetical protein
MSRAIVTVRHGWYGCESGCCGHYVEVRAPEDVPDSALPKDYRGEPYREADRFFFEHRYERSEDEFAEHLIEATLRDANGWPAKLVEACEGYEVESVDVEDNCW